MFLLVFLLITCGGVLSFPEKQTKIVGGWTTTISQYPHVASLLYSYFGANHRQTCGGTILNTRSILTAAHCVRGDSILRWRIRTGSTYANSGGTVYNVGAIIAHALYDVSSNDNDVAILRSSTTISYNLLVQPATIASYSYYLADNQPVWAVGWGATASGGLSSENLLQVQIWSVNQNTCRNRYSEVKRAVTDNMLCSGWLDVGGRDQCQGDSGSPLYHKGIVVGVCSWGLSCAMARYPGVNARVSQYTSWIQNNA